MQSIVNNWNKLIENKLIWYRTQIQKEKKQNKEAEKNKKHRHLHTLILSQALPRNKTAI